ncbi:hypothetical protein ACIF85_45960 [Streptomyces sp. NPDC086033]|uniref:hypothetical protein n=1 Tax=unclassified Streptomyces TaxID=2593676 RepID=UPI0008516C34
MIAVWMPPLAWTGGDKNRSTWDDAWDMICVMFRYAFALAASAVADAPKAAVPVFLAAADGARS